MSDKIEVKSRNLKSISVGKLQARYSVDGSRIIRYFVDFWHNELSLHKELSASELYLLQGKVDALMVSWDKKLDDHNKKKKLASGKDAAEQMTLDAAERLEALTRILSHTLSVDDRVEWDSLKDTGTFSESSQFQESEPKRIQSAEPKFQPPKLTLLDTFLGRKKAKLAEARRRHAVAVDAWQRANDIAMADYERKVAGWSVRKKAFEADYNARKALFITEQARNNAKVDALARGVATGEPESIIEHVGLVLERSDYGDLFEKSFEVDYVPAERTTLIEYALPSTENMPTLKSARFISATGEIRETHISEKEKKSNFDSTCYQICLRTIHEVFEADEFRNIDKVLFNGFSTYVDRSSGRDTTSCIMSILVDRADFESVDLSRVDPKTCFKSLKGVSASTLSALAPVPPVMKLNREDRRFIEARSTVGNLDESTNLAAMDWADFEHLVRELFEKEFSARGGEVKITQASSDGGVDAVAFDPDPISGGKIVIQAKRYTKTVGVSAVRDLFGTMQHENASRGILITTSDYGPDAHKFASGKPITLFTGSNLLHLLGKHGYRAKIDIREARRELNLRG